MDDYLKYLRPIRRIMCKKLDISQMELDLLLFLRSEKYFSARKIKEYEKIIKWDWRRVPRLIEKGHLEIFRNHKKGQWGRLYKISYPTQRALTEMYHWLNGEDIATSRGKNPLIRKKLKYTDKRYRDFLIALSKETK